MGGLLALSACSQWDFGPEDFLGGGPGPSEPPVPTQPPRPDLPPAPTVPPVANYCEGQFQSTDDVLAILQNDLLSQDADDRPFTRYILLNDRFNEGLCTEDLDADRIGLFTGLQRVSLATRIQLPIAIDSNELLYRVDIRDYDWNRTITVNGTSFDDGWQAMLSQNPFAVEYEGDEADEVKLRAQTAIPWVSAGSFLNTVSQGPLYYSLIDVNVNQSLDDFVLTGLGIDVTDNLARHEMIRAGHLINPSANEAQIIERHDIEFRQGYLWWEYRGNFEFAPGQSNAIVDDPLRLPAGASTIVYSLPNQFMAFIVSDQNSKIVVQGTPRFEVNADALVAPTPLSVAAQHAIGFPVIVDEVRPRVEANPFNFNADDFESVQELYPNPRDFAQVQSFDFRQAERARQKVGLLTDGQEPVNLAVQTFGEALNIQRLAAELGLPSAELEANLGLLDPVFANAANVSTPRAAVAAQFFDAICIMQSFSMNRPTNCL